MDIHIKIYKYRGYLLFASVTLRYLTINLPGVLMPITCHTAAKNSVTAK